MDNYNIDLQSSITRKKLAAMLTRLFDHWELNQEARVHLLGGSELKEGHALLKSRDMLDRAGYLLAIHKNLRLLYPKNPNIRYAWVNFPNRVFDNFTPLYVMQSQGIIGMARIDLYLDRLIM
jgi:hypothetical protein